MAPSNLAPSSRATRPARWLLSEQLIEEVPAQGSLPEWRRGEDKGAVALRITAPGLAAIGAGQGAEAGGAEARPPASGPARLRAGPPRRAVPNRSRRR